MTRIATLLEKLERLRQVPGASDWFGAAKHEFRLRPPLPEAEVAAFEARHRIALPEDYRTFLIAAGDGGAGPYYGIQPLSNWSDWFEDEAEEDPAFLSRPCPMVYGSDAILKQWPQDWARGCINICDQGCTYAALLVVTGQERGRVVYINVSGGPAYFVRDRTFLDWYERWLDTAAELSPYAWFGCDNPDYERLVNRR